MDPKNALSPRALVHDLRVIFTSSDDPPWAVARMLYGELDKEGKPGKDAEPRVGIRYTGALDDENDKGHPQSHSNATWFLIPHGLDEAIVALAETFAKRVSS